MSKILSVLIFLAFLFPCSAQYNWKLEKQKSGINVYLSDVQGSDFKAVKVECTLTGTFARLVSLLTNVSQFSKWIYKNKSSTLMKKNSMYDIIYYSETIMPWPLSNRDVIIHLKINTDSLPRMLTITGRGEPELIPETTGKVRVSHFKANWKVTMLNSNTIHINYILEIDPGGNIPPWLANSFVDKGPYETFLNIAEHLKK